MEFIFDEEKYFKKIDNLCTIALPEKYGTIHIATEEDKWLIIIPKNQVEIFKEYKKHISPKKAIELAEQGLYQFQFVTGIGTRETIQAVWMMKDAIGKPYLKHWTELVNVFQDATEPLIYEGQNIDLPYKCKMVNQVWCYEMANAILGLENHNDVLQRYFHADENPNWREEVSKTKIRWTTTINE